MIIIKRIIFNTLTVIGLSFILHSVYNYFPSFLTSLFFPVNESIWEHNKLILISYTLSIVPQLIFFKENKNIITRTFIASLICILFVNITLTPIYLYILKTNDNFIVTITIYVISTILSFILSSKLLKKELPRKVEILSILGIVLTYIILMYLTYYPLKLPIFYDYRIDVYGIPPY